MDQGTISPSDALELLSLGCLLMGLMFGYWCALSDEDERSSFFELFVEFCMLFVGLLPAVYGLWTVWPYRGGPLAIRKHHLDRLHWSSMCAASAGLENIRTAVERKDHLTAEHELFETKRMLTHAQHIRNNGHSDEHLDAAKKAKTEKDALNQDKATEIGHVYGNMPITSGTRVLMSKRKLIEMQNRAEAWGDPVEYELVTSVWDRILNLGSKFKPAKKLNTTKNANESSQQEKDQEEDDIAAIVGLTKIKEQCLDSLRAAEFEHATREHPEDDVTSTLRAVEVARRVEEAISHRLKTKEAKYYRKGIVVGHVDVRRLRDIGHKVKHMIEWHDHDSDTTKTDGAVKVSEVSGVRLGDPKLKQKTGEIDNDAAYDPDNDSHSDTIIQFEYMQGVGYDWDILLPTSESGIKAKITHYEKKIEKIKQDEALKKEVSASEHYSAFGALGSMGKKLASTIIQEGTHLVEKVEELMDEGVSLIHGHDSSMDANSEAGARLDNASLDDEVKDQVERLESEARKRAHKWKASELERHAHIHATQAQHAKDKMESSGMHKDEGRKKKTWKDAVVEFNNPLESVEFDVRASPDSPTFETDDDGR
eukprot:COSAG01_NODE_1733_length_9368_cov_6.908620_3_plen_594_part_00